MRLRVRSMVTGFGGPVRFDGAQHIPGVDRRHIHIANHSEDVGLERA